MPSSACSYFEHRDLPSFPTRRSSDLFFTAGMESSQAGAFSPFTLTFSRQDGEQRSEEHTSELQSLRHLVCRLLLAVTSSTEIYPLSLHDALPICSSRPAWKAARRAPSARSR